MQGPLGWESSLGSREPQRGQAELPPPNTQKPRRQGQNTTHENLGPGETSAPQPISAVPSSQNTGQWLFLPLPWGPREQTLTSTFSNTGSTAWY